MNLLFKLDDQVHLFSVEGSLNSQDCTVLKSSLFRFFETKPSYTVLDLSRAQVEISETELQKTLGELGTFAHSRNLNLSFALTSTESIRAKQAVLEIALRKQIEILNGKLELREKMRKEAEILLSENQKLKGSVDDHVQRLKSLKAATPSKLSPFIDKLWSEQ